jgi:phage gp29-like protein
VSNGQAGHGVFGMPGIPLTDSAKAYNGATRVASDDPAFQPPGGTGDQPTRARSSLVYRDLPVVTVQNTWSVDQARSALYSHVLGVFATSSDLWEAIIADPRVVATLGSRVAGLFGREIRFKAANDSAAAREVLDAWEPACRKFFADAATVGIHTTTIGMGFAPAQLVWDTSKTIWNPIARPWHTRFTYYDWQIRRMIALSLDGPIPIVPGDGKWLMHAPFGEYRGWIRGVIRAVTEPYLLRHFAFRDMARFSEVHGMPARVGMVPAVSDATERAYFEQQIASIGSDAAMILPQGIDPAGGGGYDYKLVEATDRGWETFPGLIDRCDMDLILAILFQNLTTEVKGGSYAAASSHMDIRQSGLQFDDAAWSETIMRDVARPFAWLNFGDADLAPVTYRDVEPRADLEGNAKQFQQFGTAIEVLARGGVKFKDVEEVRKWAAERFGLYGLPDFEIGDAVVGGLGGQEDKSKLPFTPLDPTQVVTVDEARSLNGLPPLPEGGDVTISEYHADKAAEKQKDVDTNKAESAPKPAPPAPKENDAPPNDQEG